jgi:hypothetical protein
MIHQQRLQRPFFNSKIREMLAREKQSIELSVFAGARLRDLAYAYASYDPRVTVVLRNNEFPEDVNEFDKIIGFVNNTMESSRCRHIASRPENRNKTILVDEEPRKQNRFKGSSKDIMDFVRSGGTFEP